MPFGVDLCRFGENKNAKWLAVSHLAFLSVRLIGLEPTRRETPDPKSGASTNSATSACLLCRLP